MAVQLDPDSIVMAKNVGGGPVTLMYDSRVYRLEPDNLVPMPFAAAALWFGDPRASDSIQSIRDTRGLVAFVPDRETEVRRLRAKYDNKAGDERVIENAPQVELYSVPENERIYSVLDDPAGERVIEASQTVQQQGDLLAIVSRQQKQIELLMTAVSNSQQTGLTPTDPGASPTTQTSTIEPPHVPGVPQSPPAPVPDELMSQVTDQFPQDGDVIDTDAALSEPEFVTDLPEDAEGHETPSPDSAPAKPAE